MDLVNSTAFPGALFRAYIGDDVFAAAAIVRVTYDVVAGGRLAVAAEQAWPVSLPPWQCAYGPMESDEVFYRGGVDLFVFGHAWAPAGRQATSVDVRVSVGANFAYEARVFGDRVWEARGGEPAPSEPAPFTSVPLTLDRAYGGTDVWDELPIPFTDNPAGRGFALSAESAVGRALPNVEHPGRLLRVWSDRPEPVGFGACPLAFGPRLRRGAEMSPERGLERLDPRFFNTAFPELVVPAVAPGEWVRLQGVNPHGDLVFAVPAPPATAVVSLAERRDPRQMRVDQIGVEPGHNRVFVTYRYPFRYRFRPMQRRACELVPTS